VSVLRVLASGVDGLEVTARGGVRQDVWDHLEAGKREAQEAGEPVPFEMSRGHRLFLILPHGRRGWQYWLTSPDMELGIGRNRQGVPVYGQLHSAYLHSLGPELALGLLGTLLQVEVMSGPFQMIGTRVDLYADVQGWAFELADMERFAARGRYRRTHAPADGPTNSVFMSGRRVTSFRFGRDALVARVYDKTAEIARRGQSWLPDLWGERDESKPVWRVEFQLRRAVISEFGLTGADEVLASVQDIWEHCAGEWLTLRERRPNRQRARWPVDASWAEVRAVRIAPSRTGVIRRRVSEANETMLVRQLQGHLSSWAAMRGHEELGPTLRALDPRVTRYLRERDRTFASEVRRKRGRLMEVSGPEGESQMAGAASGAHQHGHEDGDGGRVDGERATAPVGAEPPTQPEGSEPNRSNAKPRPVARFSEGSRRWVRDGGVVAGARQRETGRRATMAGRRRSSAQGRGRSASVSGRRGGQGR
jgi:hypothetical protein